MDPRVVAQMVDECKLCIGLFQLPSLTSHLPKNTARSYLSSDPGVALVVPKIRNSQKRQKMKR